MPHLLTAKYNAPVRTPTHDRTTIPRFIGFRDVTLVLGFDPLGFLNILDRKLAQALGFSIVGNRIIGGQQIPSAFAGAVTSHAYHERLLMYPLLRERRATASAEQQRYEWPTWILSA